MLADLGMEHEPISSIDHFGRRCAPATVGKNPCVSIPHHVLAQFAWVILSCVDSIVPHYFSNILQVKEGGGGVVKW